jgi:hypothetical protein
MNYVVDKLRKNGFLIQILPPPHICVIYISWDPNELKPSKSTPLQIKPTMQQVNAPTQLPPEPYIPRFVTKTEFP